MRAVIVRIAAIVVLVLGSASPARAFGWDWLDYLSGPGPFIGVQYEQKFYCHFENADSTSAKDGRVGISGTCLKANREKGDRDWRKRLLAAGVGTRVSWSVNNDLPYDIGVRDSDKTVRQVQIHAFLDRRLGGTVHGGVAFGTTRFSGDRMDEPFWRPTVEARLTAKLFAASIAKWSGSFDLRAGRRWFIGDMEARDFGASGPFRVSNDGVWFGAIVFDFN